jgi:hypothetical protein
VDASIFGAENENVRKSMRYKFLAENLKINPLIFHEFTL